MAISCDSSGDESRYGGGMPPEVTSYVNKHGGGSMTSLKYK